MFELKEHERKFFERELSSFVPERVFDAHAHLSHRDFFQSKVAGLPDIIDIDKHCRYIDYLHPGRQYAALFIALSFNPDQLHEANEWTARNIAGRHNLRGQFIIRPDDDPEWVRQEVRKLGMHGLKCYYAFALGENKRVAEISDYWSIPVETWNAEIPDYLPERLVSVADEQGWPITLHLVKDRAVADSSNIHWIRHYCKTYPNMKLILAHSARGFQPAHNLEGLPKLKDLDNLYFDTSLNCEPLAHIAIIRNFGHEKLMYGSDGLVGSHQRGRSAGVGDSFIWLDEHRQDTQPIWSASYKQIKPVLFGLEHLRSLKWACWTEKLSDSAIEDIFWNNAARLFNLT